jgi:hypothetical protein
MPGGFHSHSCLSLGCNNVDDCLVNPTNKCGYCGLCLIFYPQFGGCGRLGNCDLFSSGGISMFLCSFFIFAFVGVFIGIILSVVFIVSITQKRFHYLNKLTLMNKNRVLNFKQV